MKTIPMALLIITMLMGCTAQKLPKQYRSDKAAGYFVSENKKATRIAITGGNGSHDFLQHFGSTDGEILSENGKNTVLYSEDVAEIGALIPAVDILMLTNNQPLDSIAKAAIFSGVNAGKLNLLIYHPSTWYNWKDWPEYNRKLVGGGSRSHEKLQEFVVTVVQPEHPIMKGVPTTFKIVDELYRWEQDSEAEIEILAVSKGLESGEEFPSVWIVKHPKVKIVGNTFGHDERAHAHKAYQTILKNSLQWVH